MKIHNDSIGGAIGGLMAQLGARRMPMLEVGAERVRPFGGKLRTAASRDLSVGDPIGSPLPSATRGAANEIMDLLSRIGGTPCRMWGATPPVALTGDQCPNWRKVCGAILPYNTAVPLSSTAAPFTVLAKKWFWPLFWVDASASTVTVVNLTFQGDPVFENGTGSGALIVSSLFAAAGNYGFVPGLPAIDNTNGLVFTLANSAGAAAQFQGMFIGLSIRN